MRNEKSPACMTCQYCFSEESGKKGSVRHRCGVPGRWRGYTVGFGKYPPADRAPAWCDHYNEKSEVTDHEKVYSSKAGATVYALTPEQLSVFQEAGYQTPTPEQVIADAANIQLTPPEGARALVVFFKSGIFSVRVKTLLLAPGETSGFVGELIAADVLRQMAQQADPASIGAINDALASCLDLCEVGKEIEATRAAILEIDQVIGQLEPQEREIIRLWYIERKAKDEIAAELNYSSSKSVYELRNKAVAEFAIRYFGAGATYPQPQT